MFIRYQSKIVPVLTNVLLVLLVGFTIWQVAAFHPWQPETRSAQMMMACTTTISENITSDTTWDAADSPVCLSTTITVGQYAVLTIEPGVTVQAQNTAGLVVMGRLNAAGTSTDPVFFIPEANTAPGQWIGLVFDGYYGVGKGTLDHVLIRYGGAEYYGSNANLILDSGARVTLTNSQVTGSLGHGVLVEDQASRLESSSNFITDNGGYPMVLFPDGAALASANTFSGNTPDRILISSKSLTQDGTWRKNNGSGEYELADTITIDDGATLTLEPGVTVRAQDGVALLVKGGLNAVGTEAQPIVLTSVLDSSPGQWVGLVFDGFSSYSHGTLEYTTVRYGGQLYYSVQANVIVEQANVSMSRCLVTNSAGDGVWVDEEAVIQFNNSSVVFSGGYGMVVYLDNLNTIQNNSFSFNNPNRILIQSGTFSAP